MKRGKFIDNQFASPFPYIHLTAIRQEHVARLSRFPWPPFPDPRIKASPWLRSEGRDDQAKREAVILCNSDNHHPNNALWMRRFKYAICRAVK